MLARIGVANHNCDASGFAFWKRLSTAHLALDETRTGKRPGVLVAHEGFGLSEHAKGAAERLAEAGYVAFALDYHGDGKPLSDIGEVMRRIQSWMADP